MRTAEQTAGAVLCCRQIEIPAEGGWCSDDLDKATAIVEADRAALVEEIAAWVDSECTERLTATYTLTGAATADAIRARFRKASGLCPQGQKG